MFYGPLGIQYLLPAIQSRPEAIKISEDEFGKLLSDVISIGRVSLNSSQLLIASFH